MHGKEEAYEVLGPLVEGLLLILNEEEASVLRLRYGLDDGFSKSYAEIGRELGLSRVECLEIETRALAKLHAHVTSDRGTAPVN